MRVPFKAPVVSLNSYAALLYHLLVALALLFLSRFVFYLINASYFSPLTAAEWGSILWGGLRFDIAAVCYLNALFALLQVLPGTFRYHHRYRSFSRGLFVTVNALALLVSCIDMAYFKFTLRRSTAHVFREFANEKNLLTIGGQSLLEFWYLLPVFLIGVWCLFWLYDRVTVRPAPAPRSFSFYAGSGFMSLLVPFLFVGGIRGDWKYTTRPITMSNAGAYVQKPATIALVLNTPFCLLRTIRQQFYREDRFMPDRQAALLYDPVHRPRPGHSFR